jgi:type I restriction-modification system DNA methylase subunit
MEWIIRALKPNGKAFIVVPDGIFNRQNDKNIRQFLLDECIIEGIISLPIKTFFTTPKKTYILCITKKANKRITQTDPVFTYFASEIGESRDVYRFSIPEDDLTEAVALFSFYKGNKKGFAKINTDKRCKVQPIEKFLSDNHWSIDRWWSKEEQIELGIIEEENSIDLVGFTELINDVSNTLNDYSSLLKEVSEKKTLVSNYKEVFLSDTEFFDLAIGKRIVKKQIIKFKGSIPIFSANVNEPIGFHNVSNINDFSNNFVLWGIDGDFEYRAIPKNTPFISTDHCGTVRIKTDNILPEFLMIQLESVKHKYGFDRGLRASLKNMRFVSMLIPIDIDGTIDVSKQLEIMEKYQYIKEIKEKIGNYTNKINEVNVSINNTAEFIEAPLAKLFDFPETNSNITKTFCKQNEGDIPVYASSKSEDSVLGFIKPNIKGVKYYHNCLSWNRNGSVGYVFYRDHIFATNEDHRALVIKKAYNDLLSPYYLKYEIQNRLFENGFSFMDKAGVDKIKKIKIKIPVVNGSINLSIQNDISQYYHKIVEMKGNIDLELRKVLNTQIDFE